MSRKQFTMEKIIGMLLEAWASMKSFKLKDGSGPSDAGSDKNPEVDFRAYVESLVGSAFWRV